MYQKLSFQPLLQMYLYLVNPYWLRVSHYSSLCLRDTVPKIQAGRASDGAEILSFFGILSVLVTEMRSQKFFSRK